MDVMKASLDLHRQLKGKIKIENTLDIKNKTDLSLVYTPGVASSCLAIKENSEEAYELTGKGRTVAVISDGTAVLGLGDIGPLAAMPVMEGKCAIFKRFAGINAVPIVLNTKDVDELVTTIAHLAPSFGGINLEDISAPRCFEVEERLRKMLDIPVFHDDQHGTAIACGAALINAFKYVDKNLESAKIVINGAGSAGIAISKFLIKLGAKNLVICDKNGILNNDDPSLNSVQKEMAGLTNKDQLKGDLSVALNHADALIGVSAGNIVDESMVEKMHPDAVVFAMANPIPEISRERALRAGVKVYGAGISNIPNQINNALVFPGLFKGLLESRVKQIDDEMEVAACKALADLVTDETLSADYIIPDVFNENVTRVICEAIQHVQLSKI